MRALIVPSVPNGFELYVTDVWCMGGDDQPKPPFVGRGWIIGTRTYTYEGRNWPEALVKAEDLYGFRPMSASNGLSKFKGGKVRWSSAAELVILARSRAAAQRAANLLCVAHLMTEGSSWIDHIAAIPEGSTDPNDIHRTRSRFSSVDMQRAAAFAARLSSRRTWHYAAMKWWASMRAYGAEPWDFHPSKRVHHGVTDDPFAHVCFAQAVTTAYGVLEDLGVELRASTKMPSVLGGQWNPPVKADLEERLTAAQINLTEPLTWLVRGSPTRLESKRPIPIAARASWAGGPNRDRDLSLIDAIARASWLRSKVSAHGTGKLTVSLTPVDVHNVQHLARRILMEVAGFWFSRPGTVQPVGRGRRRSIEAAAERA